MQKMWFIKVISNNYPTYPLSEKECLKIGGHCFKQEDYVINTNPPTYHRVCRHCGLVEQGGSQPSVAWRRDSFQPNLAEGK